MAVMLQVADDLVESVRLYTCVRVVHWTYGVMMVFLHMAHNALLCGDIFSRLVCHHANS